MIFSISVWQVIVEAIFNITYIAWNIFFATDNKQPWNKQSINDAISPLL